MHGLEVHKAVLGVINLGGTGIVFISHSIVSHRKVIHNTIRCILKASSTLSLHDTSIAVYHVYANPRPSIAVSKPP